MTTTVSADEIGRALEGRRMGADSWMVKCPAHDDKRPSLHVTQAADKVLVHCHTGCRSEDVIRELQARGLWPTRERQEWTPEKRIEYAYLRVAARQAKYWAIAVADLAEMQLERLPIWAPTERLALTKLIKDARSKLRASRTRRYLEELDNAPDLTRAIAAAGMLADKRWQRRVTENYLDHIAEGGDGWKAHVYALEQEREQERKKAKR